MQCYLDPDTLCVADVRAGVRDGIVGYAGSVQQDVDVPVVRGPLKLVTLN